MKITSIYLRYESKYPALARISRFIVVGAIGAAVDLAILYMLAGWAHVWYIASAAIAFIISVIVSFILQKHWTFGDRSRDRIQAQASWFFSLAAVNVLVNTFLVYAFVQFLHTHYLLGQIGASAIIAVESFFIYKYLFRAHVAASPADRRSEIAMPAARASAATVGPIAWLKEHRKAVAMIFILAVLARLAVFWLDLRAHSYDLSALVGGVPATESARAAHDAGIGGDCYYETSMNIMLGNGFSCQFLSPHAPYQYGVPLYPLFLVAILFLAHGYLAVILIQILLGSTTPIFGMYIADLFLPDIASGQTGLSGNAGASLFTGVFLALAPTHLLITSGLSPEALFMPLFSGFVILCIRYLQTSSVKALLWSGCLLGLATLVKPTTQYLPIVLIVFVLWHERRSPNKRLFASLGLFLGFFLLMLAPWVWGNYRQFGVVSLSTQPERALYVALLPSVIALDKGISFPAAQAPLLLMHPNDFTFADSAGIDGYVISELTRYPVGDAKMALISPLAFFTGDGVSTVLQAVGQSPYAHRGAGLGLILAVRALFYAVTILFFVGLYRVYRSGRSTAPFDLAILLVAYFMLTTMSDGLAVTSRFRMPIEALIFAVAYAGGAFLWEKAKKCRSARMPASLS